MNQSGTESVAFGTRPGKRIHAAAIGKGPEAAPAESYPERNRPHIEPAISRRVIVVADGDYLSSMADRVNMTQAISLGETQFYALLRNALERRFGPQTNCFVTLASNSGGFIHVRRAALLAGWRTEAIAKGDWVQAIVSRILTAKSLAHVFGPAHVVLLSNDQAFVPLIRSLLNQGGMIALDSNNQSLISAVAADANTEREAEIFPLQNDMDAAYSQMNLRWRRRMRA